MLYAEFLLLLAFLYAGSRYGGIGLGVVSGIGLFVEVFFLGMPLSAPPISVMLVILAVVTCASILEAAGGLKFMLQVAERILRSNKTYYLSWPTCHLSDDLNARHRAFGLLYYADYR